MQFTPKSREHWRDWLYKNHAGESEVWVVFFKKNSRNSDLSYNDAVEEALCFGWIPSLQGVAWVALRIFRN